MFTLQTDGCQCIWQNDLSVRESVWGGMWVRGVAWVKGVGGQETRGILKKKDLECN